jgi:predicted HicB family RNase H-like nuclease
MNTMTYKGCATKIEHSDEDGCFIGHIAGIKDTVGFHAESVKELRAAFEEAAKDHLALCGGEKSTQDNDVKKAVSLAGTLQEALMTRLTMTKERLRMVEASPPPTRGST